MNLLRLIRFSNFAYRLATKKKLILFLNSIIFISIFALSASILSMFYENKIVQLDTKLTLLESEKIIVENEIPKISNSTTFINNILTKKLFNQTTLELMREIKLQDEVAVFINYRDIYHAPYYESISAAQVNYFELIYSIQIAKLISNENDQIKLISQFEKKIESNYEKLIKLSEIVNKTYSDWDKYELEEYNRAKDTKVGYLGIEWDTEDISKGVRLLGVAENSPAEKYLLKPRDIIVEFNNNSLVGVDYDTVVKYLTTDPNKLYNLKIKRKNTTISIDLITSEISELEIKDGNFLFDYEKDEKFYIKFKGFEESLLDLFREQKKIYYDFNLSFFQNKQVEINKKISKLNIEIEQLAKKEADTILFAFIIQFLIFISSQYFEFSVGQTYAKTNRKK